MKFLKSNMGLLLPFSDALDCDLYHSTNIEFHDFFGAAPSFGDLAALLSVFHVRLVRTASRAGEIPLIYEKVL